MGLYLKQALVAQLVERLSFGSEDTGSNPVWGHEFVGKWRHWLAFVLPQIHFLLFIKGPSSAPRAARAGEGSTASSSTSELDAVEPLGVALGMSEWLHSMGI